MKFTDDEFEEITQLDLKRDRWPDWLCMRDLAWSPGRSGRYYQQRWNRGWRFVQQVLTFYNEFTEGTIRGQFGDTSTKEEPPQPEERGQSGDSLGTLELVKAAEPAEPEPDTVYTHITTPKGVDNNTPLTLDFNQKLQDTTRKSLLANGVTIRWSRKSKAMLQELTARYSRDDVQLVLEWWSASDEERPRQLRGQDPWPDGQRKVRSFKTIHRNFEDYLDLATTTSVPVAESQQQPTNPFMRVARNYHDGR